MSQNTKTQSKNAVTHSSINPPSAFLQRTLHKLVFRKAQCREQSEFEFIAARFLSKTPVYACIITQSTSLSAR